MEKEWMIFSPEGRDVFYFWNGRFPILINVASHEGELKDWFWAGTEPKPG